MFSLLREIYEYRDLLGTLVVRNLKIRYKRSVLGFFWTLLNPLFLIVIYAIFLKILEFFDPSDPLFLPMLVCGIIVWQFLAMSLGDSLYAVLGNANLVTKTSFPRMILPLSMVIANLVNFLLSLVILFVYLLFVDAPFGPIWVLPAIIRALHGTEPGAVRPECVLPRYGTPDQRDPAGMVLPDADHLPDHRDPGPVPAPGLSESDDRYCDGIQVGLSLDRPDGPAAGRHVLRAGVGCVPVRDRVFPAFSVALLRRVVIMQPDEVIRIEDVCKRFVIKQRGGRTLKATVVEWLQGRSRRNDRDFWALDNVSLSVKQGETVGIIGSNGAGKSTLLALITGTSAPTSGSLETRGKISSLLELGAGFHPDLSGRENIYLYGAIMGIARTRMQERFDDIVDFAGLRDWIDEPVKHYSSGMYVRLGFAVAVEVDPDILIIDEVLAVGDAAFQKKCIRRINDFRDRGKTMLVVSHDLTTIHSISDRLVLLDHGKVLCQGDPKQVVTEYQWLSRERHETAPEQEWGSGEVRITDVAFKDSEGRPSKTFKSNRCVVMDLSYETRDRVSAPVFGFALHSANGVLIYGSNTQIEHVEIPFIEGKGCLRLVIERLPVATGAYLFSFSVHSPDHLTNYHRLDNTFPITVESDKSFEGCAYMPIRWELNP